MPDVQAAAAGVLARKAPERRQSDGVGYLRWLLKKGARRGVAVGSAIARHRRAERAPQLRALTYHRFGDARHDPFCVRVPEFEAQMAWLAEQRLAVSLAELEAFRAGRTTLPPDAVVVTIDDGFRSTYSAALPILRRYGIPAVVFLPVGEIGGAERAPSADPSASPEPHLTWEEVGALSRAGITVGSHAWTHRSLGRMSAHEAREEAQRSRAALEDRLGVAVTSFAYPFGTRADFNATTRTILEGSGYRCAFTAQHGPVRPGDDPFLLSRIKVEGAEPLWMFRLLVRGGLDAWRWVDRTLWRLQEAV
jgi:peptidoglycan/xylan/chitin deacetylase (PgdA/CDA1 family)